MIGGRTCAYFIWTAVVGVAWYDLFLILTRGSGLLTGSEGALASSSSLIPFAAFLIASSAVGLGFRRWITSARIWTVFLLGCALPFLGGALYACTWCALLYLFGGHGSASTVSGPDGSWLELPLIGAIFALVFFYATIPLGILSVLTLRWVDRRIALAEIG